jgi:hypothetical protein
MSALAPLNQILDGLDQLLGAEPELRRDARMSLENLRSRQGEGLQSVAISLSRINRSIMAETLKEVREAQKNNAAKSGR